MNTYNCIIVDDSEIDRLSLLACLRRFGQFKVTGVYSSPEKALEAIDGAAIDILFLDVEMPNINGIQLRRKVQDIPIFIFISYSPLYAAESFEITTLDYIVKPLRLERFTETVKKIEAFMELRKKVSALEALHGGNYIYIREGNTEVKINTFDILFLEAVKDYTRIVTGEKKYLVLGNLGTHINALGEEDFIRIHRSYAVQKRYVDKIRAHEIVLKNDTLLPVGKSFKDNVALLYT